MLEAPPATVNLGTTVNRVDEHGVRWKHTAIAMNPGFALTTWVFDAQAGVRILREDQMIAGQVIPVWFKEWPDRTRTEYFSPSSTNGDLVAKRTYRGSYGAPDWQVLFTYSNNVLRTITDARGIKHDLVWGSHGAASRVNAIVTTIPSTWTPTFGALTTNFEYETTAPYRLARVRRPARQFLDVRGCLGPRGPWAVVLWGERPQDLRLTPFAVPLRVAPMLLSVRWTECQVRTSRRRPRHAAFRRHEVQSSNEAVGRCDRGGNSHWRTLLGEQDGIRLARDHGCSDHGRSRRLRRCGSRSEGSQGLRGFVGGLRE